MLCRCGSVDQNKLIPLGIDFGQEIYPRHSKSVSIHLIWKDQIQQLLVTIMSAWDILEIPFMLTD